NGAAVSALQPGDGAQQRGLAAARGAQQAHQFAGADIQRHIRQRRVATEALDEIADRKKAPASRSGSGRSARRNSVGIALESLGHGASGSGTKAAPYTVLVAELKSFYAVARCGTVTKAAAQSGVSQPTVTGQSRQLESRYGVESFHRQGRGMRSSDAGHSSMPMVEKSVQQETEIDFRSRDASDSREGNSRIGATGPYYIMDTVRRYNQLYPG
ncbi:hypothetical protein OY671_008748, partial [Metschnikowia pulcherrima]